MGNISDSETFADVNRSQNRDSFSKGRYKLFPFMKPNSINAIMSLQNFNLMIFLGCD